MNKVKQCFNAMEVVRKVGNGLITQEEVEILVIKRDLNDVEKEVFYKLLDEHKIRPIVTRDIEQYDSKPIVTEKQEEVDDEGDDEIREERFDRLYQEYEDENKRIPPLGERLGQEKFDLMKAIVEHVTDSEDDVFNVITDAIIDISRQRIKERRKSGWVCGTYVRGAKVLLENEIYLSFSKKQLKELVEFCKSGKTGSRNNEYWDKVLKVMLFNAPSLRVNQWYDLD